MLYKRILYSIFLLSIALMIAGCGSGPSENTVVDLYDKALRKNIPSELLPDPTIAKAVSIDEIRLVNISKPRMKRYLGAETEFYTCTMYAKGTGANSMFKDVKYEFEGEYDFEVYKHPDSGEWKTDLSMISF